ncbi:MAG: hypothetical protein QM613_04450 [Micrococcaceae bacterium]
MVNSPGKNLVSTAGHCLYNKSAGGWAREVTFIPAYYNGAAPYGAWHAKRMSSFTGWTKNSNFYYDQAFFTVNGNIVNRTGGNGMGFSGQLSYPHMTVWGYPAQAPYTGQLPYYCYGKTTYESRAGMSIVCNMTPGASGGPCFYSMSNANIGCQSANTSRWKVGGHELLTYSYRENDIWNILNPLWHG